MEEKVAALINEIGQICAQYKSEVPSRRRAWPESIKKRIFELRGLGIGAQRIATETAIPIQTIYSWSSRKSSDGSFLPVPVVAQKQLSKTPTVTVRKRKSPAVRQHENETQGPPPTVTVVTPSGYRLEGLTYEMMCDLITAAESGGGR